MESRLNQNNMKSKTELDAIFEMKDDPVFTRSFRRDFMICVAVSCIAVLGVITAIVHADKIDRFFSELVKAIFI